jgi:hypothetical protein
MKTFALLCLLTTAGPALADIRRCRRNSSVAANVVSDRPILECADAERRERALSQAQMA